MTSPLPRPAVVSPNDSVWEPMPDPGVSMRVPVNRERVGCRNLDQRIFSYQPGAAHKVIHTRSEDVSYVVGGTGQALIGQATVPLLPGTGFLSPPGIPYHISNTADQPLVVVSVLAPQPGATEELAAAEVDGSPSLSVHEGDQELIPAGSDESRGFTDRSFKVLIDPSHGSRYVTQFRGWIEMSRAPEHTHTYEEVVYILGGNGIVHLDDGEHPIGAGSSVYLPPGAVHCLENRQDQPLELLGVFCPAGSPAARQDLEA